MKNGPCTENQNAGAAPEDIQSSPDVRARHEVSSIRGEGAVGVEDRHSSLVHSNFWIGLDCTNSIGFELS